MSAATKGKLVLLPPNLFDNVPRSPTSTEVTEWATKSPAIYQTKGFSFWAIKYVSDWKPGRVFSGAQKFLASSQLREWIHLNQPEGVRILVVYNGIILDYRLVAHWVEAVPSISAVETWEPHWRFDYNDEYAGEAFDRDEYLDLFKEQMEVILKYCIHNNYLRTVKGITDEDELYEKAWSVCNGQSYSDC